MSLKLTPEQIAKRNIEMWEKLQGVDTKSLMKKYVTKDVLEQYKTTVTENGRILADLIKSGVECPHSHVGIYLTDPGAFEVFRDLFEKVIKEYHKVDKVTHPPSSFHAPGVPDDSDKVVDFPDLDPDGTMIVSTRSRTGRNLLGHGFPPITNLEERKEIERKAVEALTSLGDLDPELKGTYFSMETTSEDDQTRLRQDHFLFRNDNPCQESAGYYEDWPKHRGIFLADNRQFLSWVNEGDHMRIISMQKGGDLAAVFNRLAKAVRLLSQKLEFYRHPELGFLTNCPSNLGTAIRAGVHIKLPNLERAGKINELCERYKLQPRGVDGEHTKSLDAIYDISNKRRLGLTEYEAMMEMKTGVEAIMRAEREAAISS